VFVCGCAARPKAYEVLFSKRTIRDDCAVYKNEQVHSFMDGICDNCQRTYTHDPNMRVKCRSNCFKTQVFEDCTSLYVTNMNPLVPRQSRRAADGYVVYY